MTLARALDIGTQIADVLPQRTRRNWYIAISNPKTPHSHPWWKVKIVDFVLCKPPPADDAKLGH